MPLAGYGYDLQTMMEAGMRGYDLKRCINYRLGFTAADDTLSPRLLEPARDGDTAGIEIHFDEMKKRFYELMELDPVKGIPSRSKLEAAGLSEEADRIWPRTVIRVGVAGKGPVRKYVTGKTLWSPADPRCQCSFRSCRIPDELRVICMRDGKRMPPVDEAP